jgi:hypothetical protein
MISLISEIMCTTVRGREIRRKMKGNSGEPLADGKFRRARKKVTAP